MMGIKGMVSITPILTYKGCFFVDSVGRAKWFQDQERMTVRGWSIFLRRWWPRENTVVLGNFRKGWIELRGLFFFSFVGRESVKLQFEELMEGNEGSARLFETCRVVKL